MSTFPESFATDPLMQKAVDRILNRKPKLTDDNGALTRAGALAEARKLWGDLATISSADEPPLRVWKIGAHGSTCGRGSTWETALAHARHRQYRKVRKAIRHDESRS